MVPCAPGATGSLVQLGVVQPQEAVASAISSGDLPVLVKVKVWRTLLIADATASCGCTTPSWTKEPVAPGAQGTMEVQFDSRGKNGIINKQVAVRANTQPSITTIAIKGNVLNDVTTDKPL